MTKDEETAQSALKLALEALELSSITVDNFSVQKKTQEAIAAVREARAEQPAQQEPCGWQFYQDGKWHNGTETNNHRANTEAAGVPVRDVYPSPQPAQQQEPVAVHQFRKRGCSDWYDGHPDNTDGGGPYEARTLYTSPPTLSLAQRQARSADTWVGLTDEEFDDLRDNNLGISPLISAIEAKLKEKNT